MASRAAPPAHLRQEIFSLGGRHLGDALGGAKQELKDAQISGERRKLLLGVIRHLEPQVAPSGAPSAASAVRPFSARALAPGSWRIIPYGAAIIVLAAWAGASLLRLLG